MNLFTSNVVFAANEYEILIKKVQNDKILSIEAKEYGCYEYWKNGKTKYDCIKDFCNTIQINIVQGQEIICKTIETKIKLKPLNKKEFFYLEIKELDIYNIEHVKKYLSPTILPCALNEECDFLLKTEEKGL